MTVEWHNGIVKPAWQPVVFREVLQDPFHRRLGAIAIFASIALIAIGLRALPDGSDEIRNVLHHLNFAPLIVAGLLYGWRTAVAATLVAFLAETLNLPRTIRESALDAVDLLVELAIFGAAGIIAGVLADRDRGQRRRVEQANSELERVYTELRQNIEQMKKAERLSAAGQLSASLAHEIRNPLASISGSVALLKRAHSGESNGTSRECLEIIEKESYRLNRLLTNFLEFARPRVPRFQPADLGEIVQSVLALAAHSKPSNVEFRRILRAGLPTIECDPEQLKQVLLNLVMNAIQASANGGVVEISADARNGKVFLAVRDEGTGMSGDLNGTGSDRIFEPFFTTKENGSGLGLAISAKIVEQHGGTIRARRNEERGMTFLIELPAAQERHSPSLLVPPEVKR